MSYLLFNVSEKLYLRDPQKSAVGQAIIRHSVALIDRDGFDNITFKKLAEAIDSTEATIYRYFENKFRLLQYLIVWHWTSVNFEIDYHVNNIAAPQDKLKICLQVLAGMRKPFNATIIDQQALNRVVIAEFDKFYLSKTIDRDYEEGLLDPFNETCQRIAALVKQINPKYPFPHSLISTAINAARHQVYFSKHLPQLCDIKNDERTLHDRLYKFLEGFVLTTIKAAA
ncbi:MAG TPA: TetR/AcrR family transcriptional regulator [Chryseosolibacter sp.]